MAKNRGICAAHTQHVGGDGKSNGVGIIVSEDISKDVMRVDGKGGCDESGRQGRMW